MNNILMKHSLIYLNRFQNKYKNYLRLVNCAQQKSSASFKKMSERKEKSNIDRSRILDLEDINKEFVVKRDRYKGITIYSEQQQPIEIDQLQDKLLKAIETWIEKAVRLAWFTVRLEHSEWVPILTKNGFVYHHAGPEGVTLYRWLSANEPPNVPSYAHTLIGVGAVVVNPKLDSILVVQERFHVSQLPRWKLPGGYLEPGESIPDAAEREVLEETGVQARFTHLLALRHLHTANFNCSDIYIVVALEPQSLDLSACPKEISKTTWMKLDEFLAHPEVHDGNKLLGRLYRDFQKDPSRQIKLTMGQHPLLDKPQWVYSLPLNSNSSSSL